MAVSQTIFDPRTQNRRTILVDVDLAMIQQDEDGEFDFYIKLTTTAKKLNGDSIVPETIRSLYDMVMGVVDGTKWNGDPGPYSSITEAVEDYILYMVEGSPLDPTTAMSFVGTT